VQQRLERKKEREELEKEKNKKKAKYAGIADDMLGETEAAEEKEEQQQIDIKLSSETSLFKKEEKEKEDKSKEILTLAHGITEEDKDYIFPPINLLQEGKITNKGGKKAYESTANKLQKTLYNFGVSAKVESVSVGPTITRYELKPAEGVRVNKIANLSDDIALNLAAETIRIEAPIPGKQLVGIEIPNKEKEIVALKDIIDNEAFNNHESKVAFALGKDPAGEAIIADIAKMPHVLIAGSTGSRKKCVY
jgi:S-DNA-T family DNA segregation ATPase FtsK/SpoIIIE